MSLHFQQGKINLVFTGRLNFLSCTSFYDKIDSKWSVKPGEKNRSHRMVTCRQEISLLMLKKHFTWLLHSFMKYFSTLEEKFCISVWPCNILHLISTDCKMKTNLFDLIFKCFLQVSVSCNNLVDHL